MASPGRLTEVKADPLLTWLERLLGERAPIGIESCLDGRLFARALRELEGERARPASTGDALEDLRAGLDRAGLGERCAYMLAALDARDVSGARSLLSVIYAHYAAHHARRYADDAAGTPREPKPSASSPTRSERQGERQGELHGERQGERRAAAARALMQGPPLDEGVYVSEPHFLPPRMDVDDDSVHSNFPAAAASVSGFVPSAAEMRAAALARERAAAAAAATTTRGDEASSAGGGRGAEHDEELRLRDDEDDETARVAASSFGAASREDGDDVLRASIASLAASMDAGVLQSERDAELMAALMAEARLDAEADEYENENANARPPVNREEDHLSDDDQDQAEYEDGYDEYERPPEPEGSPPPSTYYDDDDDGDDRGGEGTVARDPEADERAYRAATAAARAELAARVSVDIASSAGGSLRSSWDRGWGSPGRAPGPGAAAAASPSAAAEARREILERLGGFPLENPLDAAADEAAELRESVAALRASLDLDGRGSRAGSLNASLDRASLDRGSLNASFDRGTVRSSFDRGSVRSSLDGGSVRSSLRGSVIGAGRARTRIPGSPPRDASAAKTRAANASASLPSPPASPSVPTRNRRDAFGRPRASANSNPPPPPRPSSTETRARMTLDARRRRMERDKAEAASRAAERRRDAGRAALMRYFAEEREAKQGEERVRRVAAATARSTGIRTPLRLKNAAAAADDDSAALPHSAALLRSAALPHSAALPPSSPSSLSSPPSDARRRRREAPLPKVATLRPGQRAHDDLRANAAAAAERAASVAAAVAAFAAPVDDASIADPTRSNPNPNPLHPHHPHHPLPRVALFAPDQRAHGDLASAAAATAAADSVARAARAAAAATSASAFISSVPRDDDDADADADAVRRRERAPLPAVASFEPDRRSHVTSEAKAAAKAAEEAEQEKALAAIRAQAAANRAAASRAAAEEIARARAAETPSARADENEEEPAWFGVASSNRHDDEWDDDAAFVPGAYAGASGLVATTDAADAAATLKTLNPTHVPQAQAQAQAQTQAQTPPSSQPSPLRASRRKGEAMWIDVGAWGEMRDAGVPSGAWGAEQATRAPAKGAEEVRARSLAAAAARRRRPASRATRAATVSVVPAYRAAEKPSNKRLIRNALRHVCLAGAANAPALRAAEAALDDVPPDVATIFVVLFRENVSPHKYRALYALRRDEEGGREKLVKIHGAGGPSSAALETVECTMKYDSGTREFKPMATSAVMPQTAAVTFAKR